MNIGIVTQWFDSGAGHVSRSYADVLGKVHRVFIYARGGVVQKGNGKWDSPQVTWAPRHFFATGIHPRDFERWVREHEIEAVLFNEQRHWRGVVVARELGLLTGGYVDYYTQDTVPFFELYDFLVCNTRRHYSVFKDHPQCCYCPWGTRPNVYRPRIGRSTRPLTFIISAGWGGVNARSLPWMDRRGAGQVMSAFRRVAGDCRLLVYSQVGLSDCPRDWQDAVLADPRIVFRVGTFDPFPYGEGDVYVYPSRLDGIGLTLPEALSSGLPAITTGSPPMNEFVRHGENGLLVAVKEHRAIPDGYYWPESICDEEALSEAMRQYLCDPQKVVIHGSRARALAEQELDWERNAADLGAWIARQQQRTVDLTALSRRCASYDRIHSPTPWQQILLGGYALYQFLRSVVSHT
jgi:glycosyltransferase involved in cell wall biosynthesis